MTGLEIFAIQAAIKGVSLLIKAGSKGYYTPEELIEIVKEEEYDYLHEHIGNHHGSSLQDFIDMINS